MFLAHVRKRAPSWGHVIKQDDLNQEMKNKLITDKMDKFVHGIGTQSIKSSLEKYNGELLFEDEKDKFIINICIPLNQNTDSWVD